MSSIELSSDIKEAIAKQLPAMVGEELNAFITQAKITQRKLEEAEVRIDVLVREKSDLRAQLDAHKPLAEREAELDKRASDLQAKDLELLRRDASLTASVALAELKGVKETQGAFLRNTIVREGVQSRIPVPVAATPPNQYNSGCQAHVQEHNESRTTTHETAPDGPTGTEARDQGKF